MSTAAQHKAKVRMARKMRKASERYLPLFQSLAWRQRKWSIAQRVQRREIRAKYYSELRKGLRGQKDQATS